MPTLEKFVGGREMPFDVPHHPACQRCGISSWDGSDPNPICPWCRKRKYRGSKEELARILVSVNGHVVRRIAQHTANLDLWESGYLSPTEPDPSERESVMRELKAAINELEAIRRLLE